MAELLHLERNECDCEVDRRRCTFMAGWYLPDQITAAAEEAGLAEEDFFRQHCTLDYWAGTPPVFVIRPRHLGEPGGKVAAFVPRGTCHHFTADYRCAIHPAKPYECAVTRHDNGDETQGLHAAVADAWRAPGAQEMVRRLYGGEPSVPEVNMLDMIEMLALELGIEQGDE